MFFFNFRLKRGENGKKSAKSLQKKNNGINERVKWLIKLNTRKYKKENKWLSVLK